MSDTKYRLKRRDERNVVLEQYLPPRKKTPAELKKWPEYEYTKEKWETVGFYGKWEDAIRAVVNQKLCLLGNDLQEQLADVPDAIDRVVIDVMESLELG